jgi:plastocyanin
MKLKRHAETQQDVLEVVHHEIPDNAAGAGAAAIPAATYREGGMTWRRMTRATAITEVAAMVVLLVAAALYGIGFFAPLAIAGLLYAGAIAWLPRMSKASAVYSLVIASLTLLMFGGLFAGWAEFRYPDSWFAMGFATVSVILPIAGIVAAVATLRRKSGADAARTPSRVVAAVAGAVVLVGLVGAVVASDATRLPGDVSLQAKNFDFAQTALTAKSGDVAIYFENNDPFAHNVKIDGHGQSPDASGRTAIRYVFKGLSAGTYAFYCGIHTDMNGTLTVT